ncbi:MAG: hypothetical protein NC222_06815 [Staphylococcus sp.]|nr:hypothetical protein [Staphylococcus sp.]
MKLLNKIKCWFTRILLGKKKCKWCKNTKNVSEFIREKNGAKQLFPICNKCYKDKFVKKRMKVKISSTFSKTKNAIYKYERYHRYENVWENFKNNTGFSIDFRIKPNCFNVEKKRTRYYVYNSNNKLVGISCHTCKKVFPIKYFAKKGEKSFCFECKQCACNRTAKHKEAKNLCYIK